MSISKKTKDIVLERDGHRCRMCNHNGSEYHLELHHRSYESFHDPDNLTTLCKLCHDVVTDHQRRLRYDSKDPILSVPVNSNMLKILERKYS